MLLSLCCPLCPDHQGKPPPLTREITPITVHLLSSNRLKAGIQCSVPTGKLVLFFVTFINLFLLVEGFIVLTFGRHEPAFWGLNTIIFETGSQGFPCMCPTYTHLSGANDIIAPPLL